MRKANQRNAPKPAHYREDSYLESSDSNKQTVVKNSKSKDLRLKLSKKAKAKEKQCNNDQELLIYSGESEDKVTSDNSDNDKFTGESSGEKNLSSDSANKELSNSSELSSSNGKDRNNNAKRIQSVVINTMSGERSSADKITQRVTINTDHEEGEISELSEDNQWDSLVDRADDNEFAAFLKRHEERIRRLTGEFPGTSKQNKKTADNTGEQSQLAKNIRRLSLIDKQGLAPVQNSQSEDTVYTQLIKERAEFDKNQGSQDQDNSCGNESLQIHDVEDSRTSNNSSLNSGDQSRQNSSLSTDETDKIVLMTKFVDSPAMNGINQNDDNFSDVFSDWDEQDRSRSPPAKRRKGGAGES